MEKLVIGTRGSKLALWQSNYIKSLIEERYENIKVELKIIKTQGDKILDTPLAKIGGKGLFVKEIENALLDGSADIAVHSMKDVPMELPEGLILFATPLREEPNDAFLSVKFNSIRELPKNAVVGTSSLRRKLQLLKLREDLIIKDLRGNVDTRIRKLVDGEFDAIILAKAGLNRLKMTDYIKETISIEDILPAVCQGTIGIELRENDKKTQEIVSFINHETTMIRTKCERAYLKKLQGGCQVPIAGFSQITDDKIYLKALLSSLDGKTHIYEEGFSSIDKAEELGKSIAEKILNSGGKEILEEVYS
ncbi:hydroxymethylbilane synthase [Deferribacteraceae bacterium V6Fe1]|nr:hydroxymethylbilane synthase [Deferribacteraceae bacterium V6Fe1]